MDNGINQLKKYLTHLHKNKKLNENEITIDKYKRWKLRSGNMSDSENQLMTYCEKPENMNNQGCICYMGMMNALNNHDDELVDWRRRLEEYDERIRINNYVIEKRDAAIRVEINRLTDERRRLSNECCDLQAVALGYVTCLPTDPRRCGGTALRTGRCQRLIGPGWIYNRRFGQSTGGFLGTCNECTLECRRTTASDVGGTTTVDQVTLEINEFKRNNGLTNKRWVEGIDSEYDFWRLGKGNPEFSNIIGGKPSPPSFSLNIQCCTNVANLYTTNSSTGDININQSCINEMIGIMKSEDTTPDDPDTTPGDPDTTPESNNTILISIIIGIIILLLVLLLLFIL